VSFVLCEIYLAFLPFHPWALADLIGASALVVTLIGRSGDATTADPGQFAGGSAVSDPLGLLAVERERLAALRRS
jgi:hypothetical protein